MLPATAQRISGVEFNSMLISLLLFLLLIIKVLLRKREAGKKEKKKIKNYLKLIFKA